VAGRFPEAQPTWPAQSPQPRQPAQPTWPAQADQPDQPVAF